MVRRQRRQRHTLQRLTHKHKPHIYIIMNDVKAYLIGAAVGITLYIVAKNFGFEMIITL